MPDDLHAQIAAALREHQPPAHVDGLPADEFDCCADAAMAVVQPELDRLTERIPYREGETEEDYLYRQIARWRSEAWQARGKLETAEKRAEKAEAKVANLLHDMATVARDLDDGAYGDAIQTARIAIGVGPQEDIPADLNRPAKADS